MKNKRKILITAVPFISLNTNLKKLLKKKNISFDLLKKVNDFKKIDLSKYDGIIAGVEKYDKKTLKKAKRLKVISRVGIGIDSIDQIFCKEKKIKVLKTNSPNVAVVEFIIGSMIFLIRQFGPMYIDLKKKKWKPIISKSLTDMTVGILGYGKIGKLLSKKLISLGVKKILVNDIKKFRNKRIVFCNKNYLLKNSELLSINLELNKKTENFISFKQVKIMRKGIFIINSSRGKILNEKSLVYGLKKKIIRGVFLDVFSNEPYKGDLLKIKNIFFTPHISSFTFSARQKMENEAIKNLINNL